MYKTFTRLFSLFIVAISIAIQSSAQVAFPYRESFRLGSSTNTLLGGNTTPAGYSSAILTAGSIDSTGAGYLRLTDNAIQRSGYAINKTSFSSTNGIDASFEYYTHTQSGATSADGITFFLFDADVVNRPAMPVLGYSSPGFTAGAFGGALSYTQRASNPQMPGLSKGFIAVAFDDFGNFQTNLNGRQGSSGMPMANSVTLRGDGDGLGSDHPFPKSPGNGTSANYKLLTSVQTTSTANPFTIAGGVDGRTAGREGLSTGNQGFRKARVIMEPLINSNTLVGFTINVYITAGLVVHHVIKDYNYTATGNIPAYFGYGFGASTGAGTNFHEIRNLEIVVPQSVPLAPVLAPVSTTVVEDQTMVFSPSDFKSGFLDPNGFNTLTKIVFTALPLPNQGVLKLYNGSVDVDVVLGQEINVSEISSGRLKFVPADDWNGTTSGIKWNGYDDNAMSASVPADLLITVLPVNDAPNGADATITISAAFPLGPQLFGFSDSNDNPPDLLESVIITTLPSLGILSVNGVPVSPGQEIPASEIESSHLLFTPAGMGTPYTTFTFQVKDNNSTVNGGNNLDSIPNTITINVSPPAPNQAPSGIDKTVSTPEDVPYTFAANDFQFTDNSINPPHQLKEVIITTITLRGALILGDVPVIVGQAVPVAAIPTLKFVPEPNANGIPPGSFTFQIRDNGGTVNGGVDLDPTPNNFYIILRPVNDPPQGVNVTRTIVEDQPYTFSRADFPMSDTLDTPANNFSGVRISNLPSSGTLARYGTPITNAGQLIPSHELGTGLQYIPEPNANGDARDSFTFQITDDGGTADGGIDADTEVKTFTFNITPVNDRPQGADKTIDVANNTSGHIINVSDFGFTDANDTPPNSFYSVFIWSNPQGQLRLNGAPIFSTSEVLVSDIAQGKLRYVPYYNSTTDPTGTYITSFRFSVGDDGSGTDMSSESVMTLSVHPVPPTVNLNSSNVSICPGGSTAEFRYTVLTGTPKPNSYDIIWDANALAAGLANSQGPLYTNRPGVIAVTDIPPGLPVGTYHGSLKLNGSSVAGGLHPISLTVDPIATATLNYPESNVCYSIEYVYPNFVGTTGGIYSSTAGLSIDPLLGTISPSRSTPGTYVVTYTVNKGSCNVTATTSITIVPYLEIPDISGPVNAFVGSTVRMSHPLSGLWESSNPSVATIDSNGLVRTVSAGTVFISFVHSNGCQYGRALKLSVNPLSVPLPYTESFKNGTVESIEKDQRIAGAAFTEEQGNGYLRLTNNQLNQMGGVGSKFAFSYDKGLDINFEYYMHGGTGGNGFVFYLRNGAHPPSQLGGTGSSLGYTGKGLSLTGIQGAFLGVAFDQKGYFHLSGDGKEDGFPGTNPAPGSITLRGDGDYSGAYVPGKDPGVNYEYLYHIQTSDQARMAELPNAGRAFSMMGGVDGRNSVSGGPQGLDINDNGFRKARLRLLPVTGQSNVFRVDVWVTEGDPDGDGPNSSEVHHIVQNFNYQPTGPLPLNLGFGFSATTDSVTNFHEIRNLEIVEPVGPIIHSFYPSGGAVGTLVTVEGENLDNLSSFQINGIDAVLISNNGSKLIGMVMPGGALTGRVSVRTETGEAVSSDDFTLTPTLYPNRQNSDKLVGTDSNNFSPHGDYQVGLSSDGKTLILGNTYNGQNYGAVYIYVQENNSWKQQGQALRSNDWTGSSMGDPLKVALSADGNTAIVGIAGYGNNKGGAWVFVRNNGLWTQQGARLLGSGSVGDAFQGTDVAISADGNTVVVGGSGDNSGIGAAWIFQRQGTGWVQDGLKLIGSGAVGTSRQGLSVAVSSDGKSVVVGGPADNSNAGAAWVYTKIDGEWKQQSVKLTVLATTYPTATGSSVAISANGQVIAVGAPGNVGVRGAIAVFKRTGNSWNTDTLLTDDSLPGIANLGKGIAMSADGKTIVGQAITPVSLGIMSYGYAFTKENHYWRSPPNKLIGADAVLTTSASPGLISLSGDGAVFAIGGFNAMYNGAAWTFNHAEDPHITSPIITALGRITAKVEASFDSGAGLLFTELGFVYGLSPAPLISGDKMVINSVNGSFSGELTKLVPGTRYYIRAYAKGANDILYGNEVSFTTKSLFPYTADFKQLSEEGLQLGGDPNPALLTGGRTDPNYFGYLRLTDKINSQLGFARNIIPFPSAQGLSVSFDYFTHGGTGADGLTFFLSDAKVDSFHVGGRGGSLGYAQNNANPGLSRGFVGVAFDEFGSFSNPGAGRQGGPGQRASSLTLRGDGHGSSAANNYEYLAGIQTTNSTEIQTIGARNTFQIAGGVDGRLVPGGLKSSTAGFRRARIDLTPRSGGDGFDINVWITEGTATGPVKHHLIKNYHYTPTDSIPEYLNYGFTGGTGGLNNYHEIRNLEIVIPEANVNAPVLSIVERTGSENSSIIFAPLDFTSKFAGTGSLAKVKIVNLPVNGRLKLSGQEILPGQEIPINEIGSLSYHPISGFSGLDVFDWTATNGTSYAIADSRVRLVITPAPLFPYTLSFKESAAPNIELGGTGTGAILTANSIDADGAGYLRLTTNLPTQRGYARSTKAFPSNDGFSVSFEYFTYGGSGADGISFFLYDATANPFSIGGFGGSLGYAQNASSGGVSKAYLGFGFDEFGSFSLASAGRQGGPGQRPSSITLRGDGNGQSTLASNYEYLTHIQTISNESMAAIGAVNTFSVAGGVDGRSGVAGSINSNDIGYRKAHIDLIPNGLGNGYIINLWITEGNAAGGTKHHLIKNYSYIGDYLPAKLSFGFAGSTGGSTNFHEVRNLEIKLPEPQDIVTNPNLTASTVMSLKDKAFGGKALINSILTDNSELIPTNMITPNGDGRNDLWVIRNIDLYPENIIKVYDRSGIVVYTETGYKNQWDGTSNGNVLPEGTYYYIIEIGKNRKQIKGYVSIVR